MGAFLDTKNGVMRADYSVSKAVAWLAFVLTALLMASDYLDRSIVVSMLPHIKAEWSLSDTQLGALVSIVAFTVAVLAVPVAIVADRWSRVKCIFVMGCVWSVATIACWFATNYWQLLTLRGLVGIGEAGYSPVGMALLATFFPSHMRATILAAFNSMAVIGSLLGVILGGIIAKHWGWHAAFGIVGVPGLALALLYLLIPDEKTGHVIALDRGPRAAKAGLMTMMRTLFATPSAVALYIGNSFQLFLLSIVSTWLPSFLNRAYGLPGDQAGVRTAVVMAAGAVGAVLLGIFADRVSRNKPSNKVRVIALVGFSSFVVFGVAFNLMAPGPLQFGAIVLGGLVMAGTLGTQAATVIAVVDPGVRATATAIGALIQSSFGLAAGPFIAGVISDHYGLPTTLAIMPVFGLLACIAFMATLPLYERDLERAARRDIRSPAATAAVVA